MSYWQYTGNNSFFVLYWKKTFSYYTRKNREILGQVLREARLDLPGSLPTPGYQGTDNKLGSIRSTWSMSVNIDTQYLPNDKGLLLVIVEAGGLPVAVTDCHPIAVVVLDLPPSSHSQYPSFPSCSASAARAWVWTALFSSYTLSPSETMKDAMVSPTSRDGHVIMFAHH